MQNIFVLISVIFYFVSHVSYAQVAVVVVGLVVAAVLVVIVVVVVVYINPYPANVENMVRS